MTNPEVYLKNTNFSDLIAPTLREHFYAMYDDVLSQPGKGNAKSSQGVIGALTAAGIKPTRRKGTKFVNWADVNWADKGRYEVKRATEKPRAQTPLQNIIDGEVKKLGGR
jgi:hypothetical protein